MGQAHSRKQGAAAGQACGDEGDQADRVSSATDALRTSGSNTARVLRLRSGWLGTPPTCGQGLALTVLDLGGLTKYARPLPGPTCQVPGLMETGLVGFQGCGDGVGHRV